MNLPTKEQLLKNIILENIKDSKETNIVDATCGNGYDLEFLATNFPLSNLYAVDIQKEAIENSIKRCNGIKDNIIYEQINHLDFFENAKGLFDLIIFNTGYLPKSDNEIKTEGHNTVKTLKRSLYSLNKSGLIIIMLYTAHDNYEENKLVVDYLNKLNKYEYIVFKYETLNINNSPILYLIEKK